jgi:Na+/proline symporter
LYQLGHGLQPCFNLQVRTIQLTIIEMAADVCFILSAVAFKFGVSGPYWYAAGATVQVLLFAMMASKTKINAPFAHTYLQIIRERWGTTLHLVHLAFGLATNILVGSMLILGGSATVNQLTGMPTLAAVFLTPIR